MGINQLLKEVKTIDTDLDNHSLKPIPDYLIQADIHGNIIYTNPEIRGRFPKIMLEGLRHPFLENWEKVIEYIFSNHHQCVREISIDEETYHQKFFYNPANKLISIIVQKITEDKRSRRTPDELITLEGKLRSLCDHQGALQIIVDTAAKLINMVSQAEIFLFQGSDELLKAVVSTQGIDQLWINKINKTIGRQLIDGILSPNEIHHITDTKESNVIQDISFNHKTRSLMVMPIKGDQEMLGILSVQSKFPNAFNQQDELILNILASLTAIALRNINLVETSRLRLKEVNSLFNISQGISESLNIGSMLKCVTNLMQDIYGFDQILIFLLDEASGDMVLEHGSGLVGLKLKRKAHFVSSGEGIVGNVALTGFSIVTNEVDQVPFYIPNPLLPSIQSEMAIPIRTSNRLIGILDIQLEPPKTFTDSDLGLMTTIADMLANGIEKSILYTALQSALRQEQAMRTQLVQSEKLAAIGRIVASVTHELNNPLQAIQNALYLVQLEYPTDPQMDEDLQIAVKETKRMAELINQMRQTYRPINNQRIEFQDIPILIEEVRKLISTHLRHHNIVFDFQTDQNIPPCPIIRDQIKQVLLNICLNAVESMPNGGHLSVKVQHRVETSELLIVVADTGRGISSDIKPFIFDPFVTTKESGTGLGLAISHEIIQRHNGNIEVSSEKNQGTSFIVTLPLKVNE